MKITNAGKDVEKPDHSYTTGGNKMVILANFGQFF